jgi:hypothetical protein
MWVSLALLTRQTPIGQLEYGVYSIAKTTRDHTTAQLLDMLNSQSTWRLIKQGGQIEQ